MLSASQICARFLRFAPLLDRAWQAGKDGKDHREVARRARDRGGAVHKAIYAALQNTVSGYSDLYVKSALDWMQTLGITKIIGVGVEASVHDAYEGHTVLADVIVEIAGIKTVINFTTAEETDTQYFLPLLGDTADGVCGGGDTEAMLVQLCPKGGPPHVWHLEVREVADMCILADKMLMVYKGFEKVHALGIEAQVQ